MRCFLDAHTRISSEFSFKEGTLNFKVIDGKLGNRQLWLAEAASVTEGFTYSSCIHFTMYNGNVTELFNPAGPSVPVLKKLRNEVIVQSNYLFL